MLATDPSSVDRRSVATGLQSEAQVFLGHLPHATNSAPSARLLFFLQSDGNLDRMAMGQRVTCISSNLPRCAP